MTKKILSLCFAGLVALFLTACESTPKCNDGDVVDLLDEIIKEQLLPEFGISAQDAKNIKFKFSDFVTNLKIKETQRVFCQASVISTLPGSQKAIIKYLALYTPNNYLEVEILDIQ